MDFEWCKRHPNYVYIIGFVGYFVFSIIIGLILGIAEYPNKVSAGVTGAVGWMLLIFVYFPMSAIVIKLKNRSLWWILLAGLLSPLWLGNQNEYSDYYKNLHFHETDNQRIQQLEREKQELQDKLDATRKSKS